MQVTVTFRSIKPSEALRLYAEEKSERLAKYLHEPVEVHWVLAVSKIRHVAAATVVAMGLKIKAEEETEELYSAIDMAMAKLEKQVRKHKEKVKDHKPGQNARAGARPAPKSPAGRPPRVVKAKNVFIKPMSVEEAALQIEAAEHDFLVFTDSATNNVNVLFKRPDGDYGLIEAEEK